MTLSHFRFLAAIALAAFVSSAAPVQAAEPTGRIVVGTAADPETLDPQMSASLPTWNIARNTFETLLFRDMKTFGYGPGLAESYRILNDTTWQFKLRRGVKFHNGEEFNADSVKFSVERVLNLTRSRRLAA